MFSPDIFKVRVFWRGSKFVFGVQTLVYVSSNVQVQNSSVGYIRIQSTNKLWVTTCTFWKQSSVVWNSHISLKSDRALKCLWTTHNLIKTNFGGITASNPPQGNENGQLNDVAARQKSRRRGCVFKNARTKFLPQNFVEVEPCILCCYLLCLLGEIIGVGSPNL